MKLSCTRTGLMGAAMALILFFCAAPDVASQVLINEVIADNESTLPNDLGGDEVEERADDMIELYNDSDEEVALGTNSDASSYYLSDRCGSSGIDDCTFDPTRAWRFPPGTTIQPRGYLVVFCDGSVEDAKCELHASFEIASNGDEPIVLWGPEDTDGDRTVVDRVWLPPLPGDVSFARRSDGLGGANVALEEILSVFVYSPEGQGTFGSCETLDDSCSGGDPRQRRACLGEQNNGAVGSRSPRIDFVDYSTNHPSVDEPVALWVEVRDDDLPVAPNINRVQIRYAVDGVDMGEIAMDFEELRDRSDEGRPLAFFSIWRGEIPPQTAGSVVEFTFIVDDIGGSEPRVIPDELCSEIGRATVIGPCNDIGLPGTDCIEDDNDPRRFEDCNAPYRYRVAHDAGPDLSRLVINEIVPLQTDLIEDTTDDNFEDYIELYNGSDAEIDLSGLWLSDRPFEPQGTPFPEGAKIGPGQYIIVWLDDDGYRCPRPDDYDESDDDEPQKCPDPTNPADNRYHTNFRLDADGEQIYLFDRLEAGLGLIHGHEFGPQERADMAFALCPDGDPRGAFVSQAGTPLGANTCEIVEVTFLRGDANGDCRVNLSDPGFLLTYLFQGGPAPVCADAADADDGGTLNINDAIFTLNYLFSSGATPNAPGPHCPGVDPTDDALAPCPPSTCAACPGG